MPLAKPLLVSGILEACASPADTAAGCAAQWADAVKQYASGIVPPSMQVASAAAALEGALAGAFSSPAAAGGMEAAFATFAVTVGGGMAPAFVATPPAGPVGFAGQFAGPKPETHAAAADAVASLIHDWMTTGSAALVAPPNTVSPWS